MRLSKSALVGMLAISGALVACGDDDNAVSTSSSSSSSGTASSSSSSGTASSSSSGSTNTDAGSTLYTRLGENKGIYDALTAIVTQELMDPEIASYFVFQMKTPVPAGHPTLDQIHLCFTNQLANAAGGPEQFPGVPADNGGFQCRGMMAAHNGLGIPNGVFDHFVAIAAGVLKSAGVADADIATIGSVLNGTKPDIVQDMTRDGGNFDLDSSTH